jgi:hypothetical protein
MGGKWLGLLKEVAPNIKQWGACSAPDGFRGCLINSIKGPSSLVEITLARVQNRQTSKPCRLSENGGLISCRVISMAYRKAIAEQAARYHPRHFSFDFFPAAGGLMSYGTVSEDEFRNAAIYMDRFCRCEPGDLPVRCQRNSSW